MSGVIWLSGDVCVSYGKAKLWPPKYILMGMLYRGFWEYQRRQYPNGDWKPTHVLIYIMGRFFEIDQTGGHWTAVGVALAKRDWKQVRYQGNLSPAAMFEEAKKMEGTPYDYFDLLDFAISGFLLKTLSVLRIFGDRAKKFRVCSTGAAKILKVGGAVLTTPEGVPLPDDSISPAFFVNSKPDWEVVDE